MGLAGLMLGSFYRGSKKQPSEFINLGQLAKLLEIAPWDEIDEMNADYYAEAGGGTEEGEAEAGAELFSKYHDALTSTADEVFGESGLVLVPRRKAEKRPFEYKIAPEKSWNDAAARILKTINGIGMFEFRGLKEFLDSGPYTARQAVLQHLGYIRRRTDVYGGPSPSRQFENDFNR